MVPTKMVRKAWFIPASPRLLKEIIVKPEYARHRAWIGKEMEVDLATAELKPHSATEIRVRITMQSGETEMVRSTHVSGLSFDDLEMMHRIALDRRFPTMSRVGSMTKQEEVAPPA